MLQSNHLTQKAKDLNRSNKGYRNFEHFRNRFLYVLRLTPVLNAATDYKPVVYFDNDDKISYISLVNFTHTWKTIVFLEKSLMLEIDGLQPHQS